MDSGLAGVSTEKTKFDKIMTLFRNNFQFNAIYEKKIWLTVPVVIKSFILVLSFVHG